MRCNLIELFTNLHRCRQLQKHTKTITAIKSGLCFGWIFAEPQSARGRAHSRTTLRNCGCVFWSQLPRATLYLFRTLRRWHKRDYTAKGGRKKVVGGLHRRCMQLLRFVALNWNGRSVHVVSRQKVHHTYEKRKNAANENVGQEGEWRYS